MGQSCDRESSILVRSGRCCVCGDAEQHRCTFLPVDLGLVDRYCTSKVAEKLPPVKSLLLQAGQQLDPGTEIFQSDRLCRGDHRNEEHARHLCLDSRKLSAQGFGQIGG